MKKTNYDKMDDTSKFRMDDGKMVKHDPYRIQPEFSRGKNKIRKNQLISQERVRRGLELQTTSKTATFTNGVWGPTMDGKNTFEGQENAPLQWPYKDVPGAKVINVFGKKNKMMSIKAHAEEPELQSKDATDMAAYATMTIPKHNTLSKNHEDFVEVESRTIPLGMRNESLIKQNAFKAEKERYAAKMSHKPTLTKDASNISQDGKDRQKMFMQIKISSRVVGKLILELRNDICPVTCRNFRELVNKTRGFGYEGSKFHRIIPSFMIQGGDFTRGDGTGGYSIYGPRFKDENFTLKHDAPYLLSMANSGPNTNGSQFFITLKPTRWLDGKHTVFGRVLEGFDIIEEIEQCGAESGKPYKSVTIFKCGDVDEMTPEQKAEMEKRKKERAECLLNDETKGVIEKIEGVGESKNLTPRQKEALEHINRLTKPGSRYSNLNPWKVLQLDHLATDIDIKKSFRKISLLIHPDRNPDDKERAQKAFDALKKAEETLKDVKRREECLGVLSEARERIERRLTREREKAKKEARILKRDVKVELAVKENFDRELEKETTKLFADLDLAHQEAVKLEQTRKAQEIQLENEQQEYAKLCKEYNKNFNDTRQDRVDSWYKFEKARDGKGGKKRKMTKYKIGTFKPPKRKMETR